MGDVADVGPVEQVCVVANLPMCLSAFPDIVETSGTLPVTRPTCC